jgi:hypothetical protein
MCPLDQKACRIVVGIVHVGEKGAKFSLAGVGCGVCFGEGCFAPPCMLALPGFGTSSMWLAVPLSQCRGWGGGGDVGKVLISWVTEESVCLTVTLCWSRRLWSNQ